jgi:chromosome segregation ATPase
MEKVRTEKQIMEVRIQDFQGEKQALDQQIREAISSNTELTQAKQKLESRITDMVSQFEEA